VIQQMVIHIYFGNMLHIKTKTEKVLINFQIL